MKLILGSECCVGEEECATALRRGFARRFPHVAKGEDRTRHYNCWELNSTAEYYATSVLQKLKTLSANDAVDIPCFCKGDDERLDTVRNVRGPVDIVLFEGWRIGVAHPNFYPFNRVVDTLVFIEVEVNFDYEIKISGKSSVTLDYFLNSHCQHSSLTVEERLIQIGEAKKNMNYKPSFIAATKSTTKIALVTDCLGATIVK